MQSILSDREESQLTEVSQTHGWCGTERGPSTCPAQPSTWHMESPQQASWWGLEHFQWQRAHHLQSKFFIAAYLEPRSITQKLPTLILVLPPAWPEFSGLAVIPHSTSGAGATETEIKRGSQADTCESGLTLGLPEKLVTDGLGPRTDLWLFLTFWLLLTVWILIGLLKSNSTLIFQLNLSCCWLCSGIAGPNPALFCSYRASWSLTTPARCRLLCHLMTLTHLCLCVNLKAHILDRHRRAKTHDLVSGKSAGP